MLQHQMETCTNSTLTAFILLCQEDNFAKTLLYVNVPKYYIWCHSAKNFSRRIQGTPVDGYPGIKVSDALGRVYTVRPNNFECFCLRLLLHHVHGPTSFQELRSVNGRVCQTFREACNMRSLLEDYSHWDDTLIEAAAIDSPIKLRYLFTIIITACGLSNPKKLWETHKDSLSEDFLRQVQQENPFIEVCYTDAIYNRTLVMLEELVLSFSRKTLSDFGIPTPTHESCATNRELLRETNYCIAQLNSFVAEYEPLLIHDQAVPYDRIMQRIMSQSEGVIS